VRGQQRFKALAESRIAVAGATQENGALSTAQPGGSLKKDYLPIWLWLHVAIRFAHLWYQAVSDLKKFVVTIQVLRRHRGACGCTEAELSEGPGRLKIF
jgi:hypothetical protein